MKKRIIALAIASAAFLMSGPTTQKAKACPLRETYYTVHYNCILGPPPPDPIGYWEVDCDGNWTGWGDTPGTGCTTTTVEYGERCSCTP